MIYKNFSDVLSSVKNNNRIKKVGLVCAEDTNALHAVMKIWAASLISPVLIGDRVIVEAALDKVGYSSEIGKIKIIDVSGKNEAAQAGVDAARKGSIDFLMKGDLETSQLLKAVVDREKGLSKGGIMSHVAINEIPTYHKLLVTTDGGMIPYPSLEHKKEIIINSVNMMNDLGYENPNVCILAATEKINTKMPETVDAAKLKELNESGEIKNCVIEGPISLDLALVKDRAKTKNYKSVCAGEADILVVPNIHVGNIMGKTLVEMADAKMAGLILGAKCPIVLTSRGSSYEEKLNSLMLACLISGKEN